MVGGAWAQWMCNLAKRETKIFQEGGFNMALFTVTPHPACRMRSTSSLFLASLSLALLVPLLASASNAILPGDKVESFKVDTTRGTLLYEPSSLASRNLLPLVVVAVDGSSLFSNYTAYDHMSLDGFLNLTVYDLTRTANFGASSSVRNFCIFFISFYVLRPLSVPLLHLIRGNQPQGAPAG